MSLMGEICVLSTVLSTPAKASPVVRVECCLVSLHLTGYTVVPDGQLHLFLFRYCNGRIMKFSPEGRLLKSWGRLSLPNG